MTQRKTVDRPSTEQIVDMLTDGCVASLGQNDLKLVFVS